MTPESERPDAKERRERWSFEDSLRFVCERYPDLKESIVRSLRTPQLSAHHTEGRQMDAHLRLIVESLNDMAEGRFPEELEGEPDVRALLQKSVTVPDPDHEGETMLNPDLLTYAFVHDIAKPDTLLVKVEGQKEGVEMTLEDWEAKTEGGVREDLDGKRVMSIGYYHPSKKSAGQHGNMGAERLQGSGVPEHLLAAIRKHEVAHQFTKINALTYEEHFAKSGLSPDEQELAIAASYADTVSSLTEDGTPDLRNFVCLVSSRKNYLLVRSFLDSGAQFRENDVRALMKQDKVLSPEDVERIRVSGGT